jgi:hypothetical protein
MVQNDIEAVIARMANTDEQNRLLRHEQIYDEEI